MNSKEDITQPGHTPQIIPISLYVPFSILLYFIDSNIDGILTWVIVVNLLNFSSDIYGFFVLDSIKCSFEIHDAPIHFVLLFSLDFWAKLRVTNASLIFLILLWIILRNIFRMGLVNTTILQSELENVHENAFFILTISVILYKRTQLLNRSLFVRRNPTINENSYF